MARVHRTKGIGWALLVAIASACSSSQQSPPDDTGQSTQDISAPNLKASVQLTSTWPEGYCANVNVTNSGTATASTWTVILELNAATLRNSWNGTFVGNGSRQTVTPVGWNASVAPGATQAFGYCATFKAGSTNFAPTIVSRSATPKEAQEQAVAEQAVAEQAVAELVARELVARELAARELAALGLAALELAALELAALELAAREQAVVEPVARELAVPELVVAEQAVVELVRGSWRCRSWWRGSTRLQPAKHLPDPPGSGSGRHEVTRRFSGKGAR